MRRSTYFAVISLVSALFASPVQAGVIYQHSGANDPTTEGWLAPLNSGIVSSVVNDLGTGIDAWQVAKTDSGKATLYGGLLTSVDAAAARNDGWTLHSEERLIGHFFDASQGSPSVFGWSDTTLDKVFAVSLYSNNAGDVIAKLEGNSNNASILITLNGLGLGYHDYSLDYDATSGLATFSVDGAIKASGYDGSNNALPFDVVAFGTGDNGSVGGAANYHSVSFAIKTAAVPEPSSLVLTAIGSLGLMAMTIYRRRPLSRTIAQTN